jgi:DNA-directed RNA polymerase specialized sigma24 family protein
MSRTDQDLLARLRSDPAAFEELYLRHVGKVVAAVTRRVDDPAEVRDLVAAAFTRAFGSATDFDPARASPLPWLLGVTAAVVAERELVAVEEPPAWAANRRALDAAQRVRLDRQMRANAGFRQHYQAMLRLPAPERAMVELVELDGLTPVQAAEALGVLPTVARLRLGRAERRLARIGPVAAPATPDVDDRDDLRLDEVGPLELELLGELRAGLYDPGRGARSMRAAGEGHHQAMSGSRRYLAVPVLVLSLAAVLGGAFVAGKLAESDRSRQAAATGGPQIGCYSKLKAGAAATAVAAGASLFPPGPPALKACVDAWKRQEEAQFASTGTVRRIVPQAMSFVLCERRDGTVGVFPNPSGLTLYQACHSIGASVPADARFAGATATQVQDFDRDLKARLHRAGLGTGCYPFRDLYAIAWASMKANGLRAWKLLDLTSSQAVDPNNGAPIFRPDGGKRWTRYTVNPLAGRVIIITEPDGACGA